MCLTAHFTVSVDNTSSNDFMVKDLSDQLDIWETNMMGGTHLHVICTAHTLIHLNLVGV